MSALGAHITQVYMLHVTDVSILLIYYVNRQPPDCELLN